MRTPSSTTKALLLCICVAFSNTSLAQLYKDASQPTDQRIKDLLSRMTIDEKVAQMVCVWQSKSEFLDKQGNLLPKALKKAHPHGLGCIARPQDTVGLGPAAETPARDAASSIELTNAIQRHLIENTRLGIPALFHEEGLHGFQAKDATVFPQAIGLASTWDPALIEDIYSIVAREIRARGVHHVLSPVVDVARDPRWGRIEETFGEDPYLVSRIGVAAVKGFQGSGKQLAANKVYTTLKHMTGHGQPESGTNIAPANLSERVLREIFFPPFEAAIKEANAASVMASYNEIDGVPSHGSNFLLQDILRGEWGFKGLVVSDYNGIDQLMSLHHVVDSEAGAAKLSHQAGVDIELPDPFIFPVLTELVKNGEYPETAIDESVSRLLEIKFNAGLFDRPYANAEYAQSITGNQEARDLALDAALKSMVLLKNQDELLPLKAKNLKRLAVIGPNASNVVLGGYSDQPRQVVSVLQGIQDQLQGSVEVVYSEGSRITENPGWESWHRDEIVFADPAENAVRIEEAVKVAESSDAVVLVIGGNEATSREAYSANHLGDRAQITLVGEQQALFDAIQATGKPVVVVLISGRPLAIESISKQAPAIINAWILGQETGTAVAKVLFGEVSPSGKLPVSMPRSVGHLPVYYNYKPTARRGYIDSSTDALYPFGFGLSYSQFSFTDPKLSSSSVGLYSGLTVSSQIKNTGDMQADEVIQLYIRDKVSSVSRPVKELKAFQRISLKPGESKEVQFDIDVQRDFSFYDINMQRTVEEGEFDIMLGNSSQNLKTVTLNVTSKQ